MLRLSLCWTRQAAVLGLKIVGHALADSLIPYLVIAEAGQKVQGSRRYASLMTRLSFARSTIEYASTLMLDTKLGLTAATHCIPSLCH